MIRNIMLSVCMAMFVGVHADAQSLVGSWKGVLEVGGAGQLPLVFHVENDNTVTMDSPEQGVIGIKSKTNVLSADSINVELSELGAQYAGKLCNDEIKGTFSQMGYSFPLNLKSGDVKLNRPQMPLPPFEYKTEEVEFSNDGVDPQTGKKSEAGGARLSGTLVYPQNFKKGMPVMLMVTGSGQQNRDEELMGHKPFLVIADYLAKHGIATLRYDDRGVGKSDGDYSKATTFDNMLDAQAGVRFLKNMKQFGKVGVLGHSEGGEIAYMLASRGEADFVVSLAGPVLPGDSLLIRQNKDILAMSGLDKEYVDKYALAMNRMIDYVKKGQKSRFSTPESIVASLTLGINIPEQLKGNLTEAFKAIDNPWMRYFVSYNPAGDVNSMKCPAFLLFGEKDMQVSASMNVPVAKSIIPQKWQAKSEVKEYKGLNHLFQPAQSGLPMEYGKIETTISDQVLKDIAAWIGGVTK